MMTGVPPQRAAVPTPKIIPPKPVAHLVPRRRITSLFEPDWPVVLVCAPAGYGKTTLLADWVADATDRHGRQTAWVQLDPDDADPFRFWSAVLAALQRVPLPGIGRVHQLSPPSERTEAGFLAAFIDAIDASDAIGGGGGDGGHPAYPAVHDPSPAVVHLVLDDVHHLPTGPAAESLDALLQRLPQRLRLVLTSRSDPALDALRQLRLTGQLREIRGDVLAFDESEAAALLAAHRVQLSEEDLRLMVVRTEGWPAAVRLAGMSLAAADDPRAALVGFLEADRNVADYLFGEVFVHLPETVRRFLLAISVCDSVTVDLAETLTGRSAARMLDRLERTDALVTRVSQRRRWYRMQPLFRQYLYAEARRQGMVGRLHRAAAVWFEAHKQPSTALEHSAAGDDPELAATMIERYGLHAVMIGDDARLRRLLRRARGDVLGDPRVALIAAAAALHAGDVSAADRHVARFEQASRGAGDRRTRTLLAAVRLRRALLTGEAAEAGYEAARACGEDCGDPDVDLSIMANRGMVAAVLGRLPEAERDLRRAYRLATRGGYGNVQLHCLISLASTESGLGEFVRAGECAVTALDIATARGWVDRPRVVTACAVGAWAAWHRYDIGETVRLADLAVELLQHTTDPTTQLVTRLIDAAVRFEGGGQHRALQDWRAAWREHADLPLRASTVGYTMAVQFRMALAMDEQAYAGEAIERLRAVPGAGGDVAVLNAALSAARGRAEQARRTLAPVLAGQAPTVVITSRTRAWLLEALLADSAGDGGRARHAVAAAIDLAAERRAFRGFVEGGPPLRDLLARLAGHLGRRDAFVTTVLGLVPPVVAPSVPLTPRERQVLMELPAMRTVEQMASHLCLAPSTVKTHLRGIYRKLGVATRRDAVIEARRRGYL